MSVRFVKLSYFIAMASGPKLVTGYAFETPGWPEFHACVRFDRREEWSSKAWILDHYETGQGLRQAGNPKSKEEAPELLRKLLDGKGRDTVLAILAKIAPFEHRESIEA